MCPTGPSSELAIDPPAQQQEPQGIKTRLNPGAIEFKSESSASESSSPGRGGSDPGTTTPISVMMEPTITKGRKPAQGDFIVGPETAASMPRTNSGQFRQGDHRGSAPKRPTWGWESPQAMMGSASPPPPPLQLMMPPTRQLSIRMGPEEGEGPLLEQLKRHGELRHFDASQRATQGMALATFFDLRGAIAAHDALSGAAPLLPPHGNPAAPPAPPRSVRFVPLGGSGGPGSAPAEDTLEVEQAAAGILVVEVTEGDLSREGLGRAAAAYGEVCGLWGSGSYFFLEYMDTRCASEALEKLGAEAPTGCQLAVRHADLDPIVLLGRTSSVAQVAASMRGHLSRTSSFGGAASPPLILTAGSPPPMVMPVMPAYSWGAAYPVFHMYPPEAGQLERAASPPAVFPNGGSPPLPSGFISVPVRTASGATIYGSSPPYGTSPPYGPPPGMYGSSPPGMGASPIMYMAPPPSLYDANGNPVMMPGGGDHYGMGRYMAGPDVMHRMAGMSMGHQQQGQQAQQGQDKPQRSDSRASARIARSHRAGGAYDPTAFEFRVEEAESGRPDARTTVMIRNIPNKYTQEVMLDVLDKSGFKGHFDFFYLPIDFRNRCNLGYAFLNFTTPQEASRLYKLYHNKRWEEYNSKKVCEITYARVQGRDPLVEHFRASKFPSDDIEFMPLVYTRAEGGTAINPLSIHQFLARMPEATSQPPAEALADAEGQEPGQ